MISNIVDFGAFVDLDGIDGLIHISELSWSHVNHPSELLSIGDTVSVKVLDIDRQRQRISLGLKQTQEDPWQRVVDTYNIGDELEGNVTKVVTFGAFVEILDGVEGLVHISELAQHHVDNPREIIQPGDPVRVKILEIDSERRRLSLSIKRVEGQVLPVRPIEPPTSGDSYDDVPELGLSEDVFASSEDPGYAASAEVLDPTELAEAEITADPDADVADDAEAPAADAEAEAPAAEAPPAEAEVAEAEPEAPAAEAEVGEAEPEAPAAEAEVAEAEPEAPAAEAEAPAAEAEAPAAEAEVAEVAVAEPEAPAAEAPTAEAAEAETPVAEAEPPAPDDADASDS
jgi:small subunit ribosomal protein S1